MVWEAQTLEGIKCISMNPPIRLIISRAKTVFSYGINSGIIADTIVVDGHRVVLCFVFLGVAEEDIVTLQHSSDISLVLMGMKATAVQHSSMSLYTVTVPLSTPHDTHRQ